MGCSLTPIMIQQYTCKYEHNFLLKFVNKHISASRRMCMESQVRCADNSGCYTRCDGHITCDNATDGEDEDGCQGITMLHASHFMFFN